MFSRHSNAAAVIAIAMVCALPRYATAATYTWSGASSANWSSAANWGGTVPVANDVARFLNNGFSNQPTVDISGGTAIGSVWNSGSSAVTISGTNALTINSSAMNAVLLDAAANAITFNTLVIAGSVSQTWTNNSLAALTLSSSLTINVPTLTISTSPGTRV